MVRQINRERLEPWISRNPHSHNSSVFHLVRTTYAGLGVAQMLARLGIPYSGMSSYSWTPEERNLYNAIKAIQSFKQISPAEFCAIVDYYPATLTGAPRNPGELMELKKGIMSGQIPPTLSYFKQSLIENLKSNEPLRYSKNTNKLTEMKIKGALNRGIQKISENDLQKTQLLTIHGAKGLEANTVFLYNGITRAIQLSMHTPKGIENEAYIWYVGITRARDRLFFVTYNRDGYSIPGVCA
jgi:superfamily I DNA/RNA helicase